MNIARRTLMFLGLCALLFNSFPAAAGSLARLQDLRYDSHSRRAVLYLNRTVQYHYFMLVHPTRLVLDLADTAPFHPSATDLRTDHIDGVRFGVHGGYGLRIVFVLHRGSPTAQISEAQARGRTLLTVQFASGPTRGRDRTLPKRAHSETAARSVAHKRVHYRAVPRHGPMVVEIDPGHGGSDPGTTGPHGLHEKTVTLAIAREVYRLLNGTPDVRAYLTRHGDYYVSLHRRVLEAQEHHADLYVSIHENAYPNDPEVRGGTCYALSRHGASDAEAAQLAREENAADPEIAGVDFSHHSRMLNVVLTDLYQTSSILAGDQLANDIIRQFGHVEPLYHRTVQHANFAVLRDPMIPSVLCETAFLSNPTQARELHYRGFRNKLARAIYAGILHYLHNHEPMEVRRKPTRPYVVKRGDTLSAIAAHYSIPMRRLQNFNGLHDTAIRAGQTLHIPTAGNS